MGNSASPALLKVWLSRLCWLKSGFLLRLIGLPVALLALQLEIYGSSHRYGVLLHRLASRLRLARLACRLSQGHANGARNLFYLGGADVMDRAQHKPASSRKRSTTPDDNERASGAAPTSTPEASHHASHHASVAASSSSTPSHPLPSAGMHSHARSMSHADIVRQGKRLSLQFPIQPAAGSSSPAMSSPRSRPQSWIAAPSPIPSPDATAAEPNILNVIAAQERYVLELKEELTKAEQDLRTLKKHYATQEAVKVRNDLRKVTKLQPLNTTLANHELAPDDEDGSSSWMQKEMERRKALLSARTTQRGGKVFSGSRHLRTLSLLSPDKSYTPPFPQPLDVRNDSPPTPATSTSTTSLRPAPLTRQSTSPDIANHIANTVNGERYDLGGLSNIQREALVRTGKQMANDFKDGFFTFIEDIRQATVGDDAVDAGEGSGPGNARDAANKARKTTENRPTPNRASSSKKSVPSKVDIGDEFWKEHGLSEPKTSPTHKKTHALKQTRTPQKQSANQADDFDSWDNWETPSDNPNHAAKVSGDLTSSDESEAPSSPVSGQASSRTSTRYHSQRHDSKASTHTASSSAGVPDESSRRDAKRNSIPWPELSKLSPSQLKRTASHLMKEWEKNLTPPPESRDFNHASGDYIGRAVSPSEFA
jgi:hypothetical protein